jgi:hypothetical protein
MVIFVIVILFLYLFLKRNKLFNTEEYQAFERFLILNGYSKTDCRDRHWIVETRNELRYATFNEYLYVYNKNTKIGVVSDEDFDGCCSTGDVVSTFKYDDTKKCMIRIK